MVACAVMRLGVPVSPQGFEGATKGMLQILYAVVFQQHQHAINIGCPPHIYGIFGQFSHGSKIACEPVSVGEIETVVPGLESCMTHAIFPLR